MKTPVAKKAFVLFACFAILLSSMLFASPVRAITPGEDAGPSLSSLSTTTLVDMILNGDYAKELLFAASPDIGYECLLIAHDLFKELESRPDAATALLIRFNAAQNHAGSSSVEDTNSINLLSIMLSQTIYQSQLSSNELLSLNQKLYGIQEVSGWMPLTYTKKMLKTIGFQHFSSNYFADF